MIDILPFASSSKGNCYLLTQDNKHYLVECGIDKNKIINYLLSTNLMISDLDGCFISHCHIDHALSCEWVNSYMPIYANEEVMNKYELKGQELKQNKVLSLEDMEILPFNVEHGKTLNYAFIFKDKDDYLLFATDLMQFTANLSKIKFTKIAIECNYCDIMINEILKEKEKEKDSDEQKFVRQINTHMSYNNLLEHLRKMDLSNCKKIILLHASKNCIDKEIVINGIEKEFKIKTIFAKEK